MIGLFALLAPSGLVAGEPFPEIDRARLLISLQRSACFGNCPDYLVTIDGNGRVVFVTTPDQTDEVADLHRAHSRSDGVLLSGTQEDRISTGQVDQLVERFRDAGFFALKDEYRALVSDNPTTVLSIDTGHGRKQVIDYVGRRAGMPEVVTGLEHAVDDAAGTARWVDGAPGLVAWLEGHDFDFGSDEAAGMAVEGAQRRAAGETLVGFIDRGLPLTMRVPDGRASSTVGDALLESAMRRGQADVFARLVEVGWLERYGARKAEQLFASDAGGCSADIARAFVDAGLAIDTPGEDGATALDTLASSIRCSDHRKSFALAEQLLAFGADPNKRDGNGKTAIFGIESPRLLELLYAHGADGTVKDNDGNSAVFSSWTDDIVLIHLQHGASPVGRYSYDKRTLREQMLARPMPKTAAWLAERGL